MMEIRDSVMRFAEAMEFVLRENDYKGGWENCSEEYLLDKFIEESKEVHSLYEPEGWVFNREQFVSDDILKELVDVANICMMIWDNERNARW